MKNFFLNLFLLLIIDLLFFSSEIKSQEYLISDTGKVEEVDNTSVKIFRLNNYVLKNEFLFHKKNEIFLPNEDNEYELFLIEKTQVLSEKLSLRYPSIKTFKGSSKNRPSVSLRITITYY